MKDGKEGSRFIWGKEVCMSSHVFFHIQTSVKSDNFVPRFEVVKHNYETMNMIAQEITLGKGVA